MQLDRLSVSVKGGEIHPEKTKRFGIKDGDWDSFSSGQNEFWGDKFSIGRSAKREIWFF